MRKFLLASIMMMLVLPATAGANIGTNTVQTTVDSNSRGQAEVFKASAGTADSVDQLNVYLDSSSTASKVELGLYAPGTKPRAKIGGCVVSAPQSGWNSCSLASAFTPVSSTSYWIAILQPTGTTGTIKFRSKSGGTTAYSSSSTTLASLPSTYTTGASWSSSPASVFADHTAAAPASPTASFSFSPSSPTTGSAVHFDGSGSTCAATPCTYTWTDEPPGGGVYSLGTGQSFDFTFSGAGTKYVNLVVTDSLNRTARVEHDVVVSASSPPPPPVDSDGDGVPDSSDQCPGTPAGTTVDANGCPVNNPPPPPPAGTCYSSPGSCGFPDPAYGNVGVPAGTTLTPSGDINVTQDGTVIDGKDVTGTIEVNANNVTIKNSRITLKSGGCTSACGNSLIHLNGPYNVTVSHVELTSDKGHTVEHAIRNTYGGHLYIDHAYQHGDVDALCHCGDADISDSYSTIYEAIPGDHLENMYVDNKTLVVTHNTLINREGQTANIFMDDGSGNHLTATSNLFAGGGWAMAVCPKNGCSTATADIRNNMFARCGHGVEVQGGGGTWVCPNGADDYGLFPRSGDYGWAANMPTQTTWSGNVWDDDGSPVGSG